MISLKDKCPVLWFTGLSGSGKTTLANYVHKWLSDHQVTSVVLDGDDMRNIFQVTGFDKNSRIQHMLNVARMAYVLSKNGIIPIVSLISPYREARNECKELVNTFVEIYLQTPLEICERRDPKGLYKKARAGEIKSFTGIHEDAPYEAPTNADFIIDTSTLSIEDCLKPIRNYLLTTVFI